MAEWVPDKRDDLDKLIRDLVDMFTTAELRLIRAAALAVTIGDSGVEGLRLSELRRDAARIAEWLAGAYPDEIERIVTAAAEAGANAALQELAIAADVEDITKTARLAGAAAAQAMTADLTSALDEVTRRVLRYPDDVYRRTVGRAAVNVTLGQATGRQVQQQAWNEFLDQGVTGFRDTAGRKWQLHSYVEMASRSATRRAYDDAKVSQMGEYGFDLVSVVVGAGSCEACARWAGKILRTGSGPTGRVEVDNAADDGKVTVNVAGTLDEAKREGWRHPNCRCSTVAYVPGLSVIADVTHYDPKAERARARLRELERQVRYWKVRAAAATTDDARTTAEAKIRDLQGRIRAHVAETGVTRQRNREQVNLGNVRL